METPENAPQAAAPDLATLTAAAAEARVSERQRIRAIIQAESAAGRQEMADHLAFETDMEAPAAVALLGKAPAASARPLGALAAAMAATTQPGIGADAPDDAGQPSARSTATAILADFNRATGRK